MDDICYLTKLVPFEERYLGFLDMLWKDTEVTCYTGIPSQGIYIKKWYEGYLLAKSRSKGASEQYIVTLDGKPIGETAFGMLPNIFSFGTWVKDEQRACALADIKLNKQYWGRGLGYDAFMQLIDVVFSKAGADDMITLPYIKNARAIKMYKRCGLTDIGCVNPRDVAVHAITKEGWKE